jgi:hypothetical protein
MNTHPLNWQSQRNQRRWAILFFLFMVVLIAVTGCSVQPRYHNRGLHITLGSGATGRSQKQTQPIKAQSSPIEAVEVQKSRLGEFSTNDTSLPEMHIPKKIISAGEGSLRWWVYPFNISDSISKRMRVMTVIGDTFVMHGKLVAASKDGIFLYNSHDPLFWVKNTSYGKIQTAIRDKILFVPYKDIKAIKKGGTIASKLERLLNGLFWFWFTLSVTITGAWAAAVNDFFLWIFSDDLEVFLFIATLFALALTIALCVVLSIVLTPILYLINLPFSKIKGRYWFINHKRDEGGAFYRDVVEKHERYRLFKDDIKK